MQYAESDGLSIAFQVFGTGEPDLVIVPGIVSSIEDMWEEPASARMFRRIGEAFRVIVFDKRGQGLSDSFEGVPTLEERMDDVRAVMRAAGSNTAMLFAQSEGGAMGALFAATYPATVTRLVLWGTMARFAWADDYPHRPRLEQMLERMDADWGKPEFVQRLTPSRAKDLEFCERMAHHHRHIASPSAIRRILQANARIDVRAILPQLRQPTLIVHRRGDRMVHYENGRYLASHIPGATYLELPGEDHLCWEGDPEPVIDALINFGATRHGRYEPQARAAERSLATVLFTDIVGSTALAATLGDGRWRDVLQQFHACARRELEPYRGREIDTSGDGMFATFDGPARAIRCALAIVREAKEKLGIEIRAGVHTGEVEPIGDKVSGLAVHIGARVMGLAGPGEVLVSSTTRDLVAGSGIDFEERGAHALKGVPGEWRVAKALGE